LPSANHVLTTEHFGFTKLFDMNRTTVMKPKANALITKN